MFYELHRYALQEAAHRAGSEEPLEEAALEQETLHARQHSAGEMHAAVRAETLRVKEEKRKKAATKEARENAAAKREAPKGTKRNS